MEALKISFRYTLWLRQFLQQIFNHYCQLPPLKIYTNIVILIVFVFGAHQAVAQSNERPYLVRSGDSIWKICQQLTDYPECWKRLAKYNELDETKPLMVNQRLQIPRKWLSNPAISASIIHVAGEAIYLPKSKPFIALVEGQELLIGDGISVKEGSVTIQFADGAVLVMENDTDIAIDSMSIYQLKNAYDFQISLPVGGVKVSVPKRTPKTQFRVKTPSGVAAVRGTEFRVFSGHDKLVGKNILIKSEVLEGEVEVKSQGLMQKVIEGFAVSATDSLPLSESIQLIEAPKWNFSCNDPGYVEWQKSSKAKVFNLVLMEDDEQVDKVLRSVVLDGSNYTFKNLDNGCYQVRVNAADEKNYRGQEAQRQLCYSRHLSQPLLSSAALTGENILLTWSPVEYATAYIVELSKDENFNKILASKVFDATEAQWQFENNISSAFVRVKAQGDDLDDSVYSKTSYVERVNQNHRWIGLLSSLLAILII